MGRYPFWFFSMFPALPHFSQLFVVSALRAQKIENRKKEFVLNLEFEILNLFEILNFEF